MSLGQWEDGAAGRHREICMTYMTQFGNEAADGKYTWGFQQTAVVEAQNCSATALGAPNTKG